MIRVSFIRFWRFIFIVKTNRTQLRSKVKIFCKKKKNPILLQSYDAEGHIGRERPVMEYAKQTVMDMDGCKELKESVWMTSVNDWRRKTRRLSSLRFNTVRTGHRHRGVGGILVFFFSEEPLPIISRVTQHRRRLRSGFWARPSLCPRQCRRYANFVHKME